MKDWNSPVYAFFSPVPKIEYINNQQTHAFQCLAKGCKHKVQQYLDKGDKGSMSNMWRHACLCGGETAVDDVTNGQNLETTCEIVRNHTEQGTISATFKQKGKTTVTYSHRQHTCTETKFIVCSFAWVWCYC